MSSASFLSLLVSLFCSALLVSAAPGPGVRVTESFPPPPSSYDVMRHHPAPGAERNLPPAVLPQAVFSAPLHASAPRRQAKTHALSHLVATQSGAKATIPQVSLTGAALDMEYLAQIVVGGQKFDAIVDTGSSDTWLIEDNFVCLNQSGQAQPPAGCNFGAATYNKTESKTFKAFPNSSFAIVYGDGEYMSGAAMYETVNIGGLSVSSQEMGVVSKASWSGDGLSSGLLGLAYPALTSVRNGTKGPVMSYDPFFISAVKQHKTMHSYFSLAINRGTTRGEHSNAEPHLGYLSFGGIAPVPVTSTNVTVPVQGYAVSPSGSNSSPFSYFAVDIQEYVFPQSANVSSSNNNTIIDSGTTLNILPAPVAQAYNADIGTWRNGSYYVPCNATMPPFSVVLAGKSFSIDPRDQVVRAGTDNVTGEDVCLSGTQSGGEDLGNDIFILGDVFLHNVVATFDVVKNSITFSQRKKY
ncbi:unnamed protein product [Mycena citricolor]|uniref:Peptidase A1 domain-containing protein n=1 Tax=Mycena citricolor TaxID=2018698 RepID=A0AAD2Q1W7_9AGAR|nr:unnamed protein product [Mycena citricolor]